MEAVTGDDNISTLCLDYMNCDELYTNTKGPNFEIQADGLNCIAEAPNNEQDYFNLSTIENRDRINTEDSLKSSTSTFSPSLENKTIQTLTSVTSSDNNLTELNVQLKSHKKMQIVLPQKCNDVTPLKPPDVNDIHLSFLSDEIRTFPKHDLKKEGSTSINLVSTIPDRQLGVRNNSSNISLPVITHYGMINNVVNNTSNKTVSNSLNKRIGTSFSSKQLEGTPRVPYLRRFQDNMYLPYAHQNLIMNYNMNLRIKPGILNVSNNRSYNYNSTNPLLTSNYGQIRSPALPNNRDGLWKPPIPAEFNNFTNRTHYFIPNNPRPFTQSSRPNTSNLNFNLIPPKYFASSTMPYAMGQGTDERGYSLNNCYVSTPNKTVPLWYSQCAKPINQAKSYLGANLDPNNLNNVKPNVQRSGGSPKVGATCEFNSYRPGALNFQKHRPASLLLPTSFDLSHKGVNESNIFPMQPPKNNFTSEISSLPPGPFNVNYGSKEDFKIFVNNRGEYFKLMNVKGTSYVVPYDPWNNSMCVPDNLLNYTPTSGSVSNMINHKDNHVTFDHVKISSPTMSNYPPKPGYPKMALANANPDSNGLTDFTNPSQHNEKVAKFTKIDNMKQTQAPTNEKDLNKRPRSMLVQRDIMDEEPGTVLEDYFKDIDIDKELDLMLETFPLPKNVEKPHCCNLM